MSIIVAIMINERAKHFIIAITEFDSILVNSFASTIAAAL